MEVGSHFKPRGEVIYRENKQERAIPQKKRERNGDQTLF
jgi:hypothetical protein